MSSPFVHLELNTPDLEAAKAFYSNLCGWTFTDMPMGEHGTYSVFKPASGPGGGIMSMPGAPTAWLAYLGVEDIRVATDKAASLGATIIKDSEEVPNMGLFTILIDPTGAMIALWQTTNPPAA
jgi:uncharacterized protein